MGKSMIIYDLDIPWNQSIVIHRSLPGHDWLRMPQSLYPLNWIVQLWRPLRHCCRRSACEKVFGVPYMFWNVVAWHVAWIKECSHFASASVSSVIVHAFVKFCKNLLELANSMLKFEHQGKWFQRVWWQQTPWLRILSGVRISKQRQEQREWQCFSSRSLSVRRIIMFIDFNRCFFHFPLQRYSAKRILFGKFSRRS